MPVALSISNLTLVSETTHNVLIRHLIKSPVVAKWREQHCQLRQLWFKLHTSFPITSPQRTCINAISLSLLQFCMGRVVPRTCHKLLLVYCISLVRKVCSKEKHHGDVGQQIFLCSWSAFLLTVFLLMHSPKEIALSICLERELNSKMWIYYHRGRQETQYCCWFVHSLITASVGNSHPLIPRTIVAKGK